MFQTNLFEQSTLEYLWNLKDKGVLKVQRLEDEWAFSISPNYIDMKDKLLRDYEERLKTLSIFYLEKNEIQ